MPVSRRRKKKSRSSKPSARTAARAVFTGADNQSRRELVDALANLADYRREIDTRRASLAAAAAETMIAELIEFAPTQSDSKVEDELCVRLGDRLWNLSEGPVEDHVGPNALAEAAIDAATDAVAAALAESTGQPDGWQGPWRVLTAAARIVPYPLSEMATDAAKHLQGLPAGRLLSEAPDGPTVAGQMLWARDAYGCRFGVTAAFPTLRGPDRWYLWDIDCCGHQAFTVHSGYYATSEDAQAAWRAGVGHLAAGGAAFAPVDAPSLLADLMPAEEGIMRVGGESAEQFAEYHRSKRLGEAVIEAAGPPQTTPPGDLDKATAATRFTAWLLTRRAGHRQPADLDELVAELADSWHIGGPAALYGTCSPHKVALTVLHMRNYYQDDFAAELIALLPDWTAWLAERNSTAPDLAERCRLYALGEPHPAVGSDDTMPDYLARVAE